MKPSHFDDIGDFDMLRQLLNLKIKIADKEALLKITCDNLESYADSLGYVRGEKWGDWSYIWNHKNKKKPELLIPTTEGLGDHASTVNKLIDIFSKIRKLPQQAVWLELWNEWRFEKEVFENNESIAE